MLDSGTLKPLHGMSSLSLRTAALLGVALLTVAGVRAGAQEDHDHAGLHFSHPLVTESPSPDTKLRLDYLWSRTGDPLSRVTERGARLEGEFAFTPGLSLAVTVPYEWHDDGSGAGAVHGTGSTEVSLKAASTMWDERGVLFGGGFSVGLPTGNDSLGIGSSSAIGLEPFVDAALRSGALELVAFLRYGTTVHNAADVVAEREVSMAASALYPVVPALEALIEMEAVRPLTGDVRETAATIAPGVKLYPFHDRRIMAGVSTPIGLTGEAKQSRGLLVSLFYHF